MTVNRLTKHIYNANVDGCGYQKIPELTYHDQTGSLVVVSSLKVVSRIYKTGMFG